MSRSDLTAPALPAAARRRSIRNSIRQAPALYVMIGIVILWSLVFHWVPIYGITIAFKRYTALDGFFGGEWIGLKHVSDFLNDPFLWRLIRNTVLLGFLTLAFGFPAPVIFALLINELRKRWFSRLVQSISYLPHFIAAVIVVGLIFQFFSFDGRVTVTLKELGVDADFLDFLGDPAWFRPLYVASHVWQTVGWGTIIYLAAMAGISAELYESATIDGAGRLQQARFITIPGIMPTVVVLFILATRNVVDTDFEKVLLMQNPAIYETADVIETYVYRRGILGGEYPYATAIGLLKNLVSFAVVLAVNKLARIRGEGLW